MRITIEHVDGSKETVEAESVEAVVKGAGADVHAVYPEGESKRTVAVLSSIGGFVHLRCWRPYRASFKGNAPNSNEYLQSGAEYALIGPNEKCPRCGKGFRPADRPKQEKNNAGTSI